MQDLCHQVACTAIRLHALPSGCVQCNRCDPHTAVLPHHPVHRHLHLLLLLVDRHGPAVECWEPGAYIHGPHTVSAGNLVPTYMDLTQ
jgi:hypothetical protein